MDLPIENDDCGVYPLVMTNIAMEVMAHLVRWFTY